jgi:NAD-dependent DNA ligase
VDEQPKTMPNRGDPDRKPEPDRETLVGSVERVTFHSMDTGFAVLKVKARGRRDLVSLVGHAASISAGEYIHAVGVWLTDRTHGLQFKADLLKTTPPTTQEGMARYLGSGMVRGIGPKLAERIVGQFGLETFEVIEADPSRLQEVSGIGEFRAGKIASGWAEQKAVRDIMVFLHSHGVSTSRAVRIFKTYGHDAIAVMTDDPYRLARVASGARTRSRCGSGSQRNRRSGFGQACSFALQTATEVDAYDKRRGSRCTQMVAAVALAPHCLPETAMKFGPEGAPPSHFIYRARTDKTQQFKHPETRDTIVELRGNGSQTVFPGSVNDRKENIFFAAPECLEPSDSL